MTGDREKRRGDYFGMWVTLVEDSSFPLHGSIETLSPSKQRREGSRGLESSRKGGGWKPLTNFTLQFYLE